MADNGVWPVEEKLQKLRCSVKNYDWGRIGHDSEVYRLSRANFGSNIDPNKPYAEFWMVTHESGQAKILANGDSNWKICDLVGPNLRSWIERNPNVLGDKVPKIWGSDLPFLLKVAGGDGTVGWVLGCLGVFFKENRLPFPLVVIIPLGTGNDLSRSFGWGGSFPFAWKSAMKRSLFIEQVQAPFVT